MKNELEPDVVDARRLYACQFHESVVPAQATWRSVRRRRRRLESEATGQVADLQLGHRPPRRCPVYAIYRGREARLRGIHVGSFSISITYHGDVHALYTRCSDSVFVRRCISTSVVCWTTSFVKKCLRRRSRRRLLIYSRCPRVEAGPGRLLGAATGAGTRSRWA